jgi:protein-L-isoaspartate O-methyltransferase
VDVAAGEGHGTALLTRVARSAAAIEIDADTVTAPRPDFQRLNLHHNQGPG